MGLTVTKGIAQYPSEGSIRLAAQRYTSTMTSIAEGAVRRHTPKDTGGMVEHLAKTKMTTSGTSNIKVQMGYIPPLRINRPAPRHTIKRFLQWYRYARLSKKKARASSNTWTTAWYYLTEMERSTLRATRYGAQFGGPHPPPTYTEAVNAGKVPLPAGTSAYAKAMRNRGFIERIRQDVERGSRVAIHRAVEAARRP